MLHLFVGSKRYSSWSLRPYLALAHTGAPFDDTTILLDRPSTRAEIAKVTPAGRVPVLHHDGEIIWDSLAICEYLHELFPAARLWPEDRVHRARARSISAEMHAGFAAMRQHMSMDLGVTHPTPTDPATLADVERVKTIWREARAIATGGPFLFGTFTIADAMYAPVTTRFVSYQIEMDATIRAYVDAIAALPAMQMWTDAAAAEPASRS